MKLEPMKGRNHGAPHRPPLRSVGELAAILGVEPMRLVRALRQEGAPKPEMRSSEVGHSVTGNGRVWYEPKAVIKWFKEYVATDDAAEKRRAYHREYRAKRKAQQT